MKTPPRPPAPRQVAPVAPAPVAPARSDAAAGVESARIHFGRVFKAESASYYLLLGTTLFLVVFGLVMVLSSSSVDSYLENTGFFGTVLRQGGFALIGVPVMLMISHLPLKFWRRVAWPMLIVACLMQSLVVFTPLGIEVAGNTNWLSIGGVQFQPSEAIKLALVVWLGMILSQKENRLDDWRHVYIPVFGVGGGAVMLVLIGGDLGTVMIMAGILFGALFFAGVRLRLLAVPLAAGLVLALLMALTSSNRMTRILSFMGAGCDQVDGPISAPCWQPLHGTWALANGGIFGVGLGNSKAKWSWLPAADNDYIFAIVGEELGLIGAIVVLIMFMLLAFGFLRVMRTSTSLQARVSTAAVLVWLIGQAFVNIGVVLGVFPVLGVPLPLVSAGGTALLTTLGAIGIVLSFTRGDHTGQSRRSTTSTTTSTATSSSSTGVEQ
ncbi:MAG TPA: putative lipid II flippase FtsW [Cryobacterium sp.]|nr:putative lipid II flippase FtsW [Cryobacterium sp.]